MQNKIGFDYNKFLTFRSSFPSIYYSYCTVFLYRKIGTAIDVNKLPESLNDSHRDYCFRRYFELFSSRGGGRGNTVDGVGDNLVIRLDIKPKNDRNHFILMSPEQILKFANYFEGMLGYHAEFIDVKNITDTLYLKVNFPKLSKNGVIEKFVLSWIRYIYEVPYSFCSYEALRLFENGIFPEMDLYNLVDFTMGELNRIKDSNSFNGGHYITKGAGYIPLDDLKNYLFNDPGEYGTLNRIGRLTKTSADADLKYKDSVVISSIEDALREDRFNQRVEKYKTDYKLWKGK